MEEMIARSCEIKREVVEHDPTEKGERALLNFGHTIGHAIEKLCGFSLYHGECVGLGILAAAYLSKKQGNLTEEQLAGIRQCLSAFGFQTQIDGISTDAVLSATKSDQENGRKSGQIYSAAYHRRCLYLPRVKRRADSGRHSLCMPGVIPVWQGKQHGRTIYL